MYHQTRRLIQKPPERQDARKLNYPSCAAIALLLLFLACAQKPNVTRLGSIDDQGIAALPSHQKTVVINFWATWCAPCVEEIPMLVRFHNEHKEVTLIGISLDEPKDRTRVQEFLKEHAVSYPVFLRTGAGDFEKMVNSMDPDWIGAIPATFVFRNGRRTFSRTGELAAPDLKTILEGAS